MPPLVSVIIPFYNAERFIEQTLRSALAQTYRNCEFILVDDGSSDGSSAIVSALSQTDERLQVHSQYNQGPTTARNSGIRISSGEYLAFLDSDDLWHPEKIARQVDHLQKNPNIGGVYSLHRIIDADGHSINHSVQWNIAGPCLTQHLLAKPVGSGSNLMVRREQALAIEGFHPGRFDYGGCEDLEMELRLAETTELAELPLYHVGYRMHGQGISSDQIRLSEGLIKVYKESIARNPALPLFICRWIMARGYRSLAGSYFKAGMPGRGAVAALKATVIDPSYPLAIATRSMKRATCWITAFCGKTHQTPSAGPRNFDDYQPSQGLKEPIPLLRKRMAKLKMYDNFF
jgi:glycosyltransferase involved in cell wall biosynthesis